MSHQERNGQRREIRRPLGVKGRAGTKKTEYPRGTGQGSGVALAEEGRPQAELGSVNGGRLGFGND